MAVSLLGVGVKLLVDPEFRERHWRNDVLAV